MNHVFCYLPKALCFNVSQGALLFRSVVSVQVREPLKRDVARTHDGSPGWEVLWRLAPLGKKSVRQLPRPSMSPL